MHSYCLLLGPYGCYLLQHFLSPEIRSTLCEYLHFLGSLWSKTFTRVEVAEMRLKGARLLTKLELLLPTTELDVIRHWAHHMVESIPALGPIWCALVLPSPIKLDLLHA